MGSVQAVVRGQLVGSSCHPMGFWGWTPVTRLGGKHLYLLSDLPCSDMSLVKSVPKMSCCVGKSADVHLSLPSPPPPCWRRNSGSGSCACGVDTLSLTCIPSLWFSFPYTVIKIRVLKFSKPPFSPLNSQMGITVSVSKFSWRNLWWCHGKQKPRDQELGEILDPYPETYRTLGKCLTFQEWGDFLSNRESFLLE